MTDTTISPATTGTEPMPGSMSIRLGLVVLAVVLGDWLFFGRAIGVSLVIFIVALAVAQLLLTTEARRRAPAALLLLAVTLIPFLEAPGLLSFLIAAAGLALFTVQIQLGRQPLRAMIESAAAFLLAGPAQLLPDFAHATRNGAVAVRPGILRGWVVPILFGTIFVWMFAAANPLIEAGLNGLSPFRLLARLSEARVYLWVMLLVLAWPVLAPRLRAFPRLQTTQPRLSASAASLALFTPTAVLRSLVLFNGLFAVQTGLDAAYLWGGIALPEGMSHAEYAHRGAYPLILTALLAAAFVLIAFRAGERQSPLLRGLVTLWVGQNVLLVVSSILRLDLYVEVYSLTYLRVAAFIWMLLVAAGLLLIVMRIVLDRSNAWLVDINLKVLAAVLYVSALANMPAIVASYNVDHAIQRNFDGTDVGYLLSLGPDAIPALDRLAAALDRSVGMLDRTSGLILRAQLDAMAVAHARAIQDWRAWSFRGARLEQALAARN